VKPEAQSEKERVKEEKGGKEGGKEKKGKGSKYTSQNRF
jgi:hypothetical protein